MARPAGILFDAGPRGQASITPGVENVRRMNASRTGHRRNVLVWILAAAAMLRFYGLNWDEGQHAHPDERWIAMVAPTITWPERAADLLDPRRSTLNPLWVPAGKDASPDSGQVRNFAYGHLPLYLHSLAGHGLAALGKAMGSWLPADRQGPIYRELASELRIYGEYGGITLVGRMLSALSDLGTVFLVVLLGRRLYDERTALLGAALVAVAVMHIQLSHFAAFDVITTFFILLAVYGSVCVVQASSEERRSPWWPSIWAGAAAGCAVASKFSALPVVAVLVLAQLLRAARSAAGRSLGVEELFSRAWPHILASLLAALLAFFITSPFAILDWKLYLKQIVEQGSMVRGKADWPFTRQYRNTTPFVYQVTQQVRWGLGWPLGIAAFAGLAWVTVRQFLYPRAEEWVLLGWALPYFILTGTFMVKFMRYMLPLLPLFILMGAAGLWQVRDWAFSKLGRAGVKRPEVRARRSGDAVRISDAPLVHADGALVLRTALGALPYLVLALSLAYALSFMGVYAQTHPWIQASRWIYEHVPDGSVIAVEHWDDHLPLSLPEDRATPGAHAYQHVELPMYEPDSYEKSSLVRSLLREADYLVFSSNRLYRTISRLPERYPFGAEFYRLFFEEKLGYVREAAFTAYPGLFGIPIVDDDADESFTVYDHPKPIVYRKVRDLGDAEWDALFAEALSTPPGGEPGKGGGNLLAFLDRDPPAPGEEKYSLLLDRPVGELPVVSDFGWNRWANESTVGAALIWWLVVAALGWLAWPLTFALFRGLRDRGYLVSRTVALLFVGYLIWLPTSMHWLQNGLPLTYAAIGVLIVASGLVTLRVRHEMAVFLRRKRDLILMSEALLGGAFLLFVIIRILNPDLWQPWNGGEKLMDIAYFNSCLRSAYFPPYDPYYADGYLNYYYYGQFLLSIVARLTGIKATVAFNLSVPLLFSLTVGNAFSIGYTLAGGMRLGVKRQRVKGRGEPLNQGDPDRDTRFGISHGLLAVLCVTILGNLASGTQIIERLGQVSGSTFQSQIPGLAAVVRAAQGAGEILLGGAHFPGFNYWDPSRVVGYTINEFPYWSFLFADLHPHMINIPFTLMVIALALNWLCYRDAPARQKPMAATPGSEWALVFSSARYLWRSLDWAKVLHGGLWALALGALAAINTWDWPAYAGLSGLVVLWVRGRGREGAQRMACAGGLWRPSKRDAAERRMPGGMAMALLWAVLLAGTSLLLYVPFFKSYHALYVGLGWSLGRGYTKLSEFLTMWGFLLFVAISLLAIFFMSQRSRWPVMRVLRLIARHPMRLPRLEELAVLCVRRTSPGYRLSIGAGIAMLLAVVWWAWKGYWVLALMVPLLALAAALMVQAEMSDRRRFVVALVCTACLVLVGIELFYLKDHLDGDQMGWWRMNTLFKFYLQAWVMLGIAAGVSLPGILSVVGRWRWGWRSAWTAAWVLLLTGAALYPILGTPARVYDRFPGDRPAVGTLDGMAFMTVGTYYWPSDQNPIHLWGDYEAIRWLQENVPGTPVLAEAPLGYYREFGVRVSSYTGLPTLIGMHESEQRYGWQVGTRSSKANELYATVNLERTMDLIRELRVEYVYVGPLERTQYPQAAAKFQQLASVPSQDAQQGFLAPVYENALVTIYRVN
jgi:YYY domain-containing protein